MTAGIECLLTDDMDDARQLAGQLDGINKKRREMQSDIVEQAERAAGGKTLDTVPAGAIHPVIQGPRCPGQIDGHITGIGALVGTLDLIAKRLFRLIRVLPDVKQA